MSKRKTVYQDLPEWGDIAEMLEVTQDFLPSPKELVFKKKLKKITIALDPDSIQFFKKQADKFDTSYQRMIRVLLNEYANKMREKSSSL